MRNITVRQLQEKNLAFAYEMVRTEQWNARVEDLRRMLYCEPKGCFLAELSGKKAGFVFSVNYGRLGWIGLLIVKTECRGIGIGQQLMETAKRYLLHLGVKTVRLEAPPLIADFYRTAGFVDEYDTLRFKGAHDKASGEGTQFVESMKEEMIDDVAQFDARYFGANRARVLGKLYQAYPELCLVSYSKSGISGYIMCRKGEASYNLGPWVCVPESGQIATDLLLACVGKIHYGSTVFVRVPSANESAVEILQRLGFVEYSKSIRMRLGEQLADEHIQGVFAIGGGMKG